jgi:serine/threonine protein kinase
MIYFSEIEKDEYLVDSEESVLTLLGYYISCQLFIEVLKGVRYLHKQKPPIIHRDLKPANYLIKRMSNKRFIKIGDFGLAKLIDLIGQPYIEDVGDAWFMAPEVADSKEYETKANVYSLGMIAQKLFSISTFDDRYFRNCTKF